MVSVLLRGGNHGVPIHMVRKLGMVEASLYRYLWDEDRLIGLVENGARFDYWESHGPRDVDGFFQVDSVVLENTFYLSKRGQRDALKTLIVNDLISVKGFEDWEKYQVWTIRVEDKDSFTSARFIEEIDKEVCFDEWVKRD